MTGSFLEMEKRVDFIQHIFPEAICFQLESTKNFISNTFMWKFVIAISLILASPFPNMNLVSIAHTGDNKFFLVSSESFDYTTKENIIGFTTEGIIIRTFYVCIYIQ